MEDGSGDDYGLEAGGGGTRDADAAGRPAASRTETRVSSSDTPPPSRHAPRLSYEAVVRLSCAGRRGIHTGFVRDISRGGMFLRLVDPEPVGRRLGFELFLPGWRSPARGVGEVAWNRPTYEGPGRPPGMALRFVALEARAIEMLAAVLPGGEAPAVEVLEPRPLPLVRRDEARERGAVVADAVARAADATELDTGVESLAALLAASGVVSPAVSPDFEPPIAADLADDLEGPMIFVPPPPLPVPLAALPSGPPVRAFVEPAPPASRLRWGSAAAGIAALGAIASLVVVGAARRDVLPAERVAPTAVEKPVATTEQEPNRVSVPAPPDPSRQPVANGSGDVPDPAPATSADAAPLQPVASSVAPAVTARGAAIASVVPATRLTALRWEPLPGGGTRVVIALDGTLAASRLRASRIGGESPRLVVRLLGLAGGAPRAPWEPATAEVRRIRAGRHDGENGGEIHLVLDLADATVRLAASAAAGAELRLDLRKTS